jgi:hypothetical protein
MVQVDTTMLIMECFPDKFAITTERSESRGQIFLHIRREDRDTYFKAMAKTIYQVFGLFLKENIYRLHAGEYTIF